MDDVGSEAWLTADEIGRKRGFPVDFSNRDDQDRDWDAGVAVVAADFAPRIARRAGPPPPIGVDSAVQLDML